MKILMDIVDAALALPHEHRAFLAQELLASLEEGFDPGVENAWAEEIAKRDKEIEAGIVEPLSHEQVIATLRARLNAYHQIPS